MGKTANSKTTASPARSVRSWTPYGTPKRLNSSPGSSGSRHGTPMQRSKTPKRSSGQKFLNQRRLMADARKMKAIHSYRKAKRREGGDGGKPSGVEETMDEIDGSMTSECGEHSNVSMSPVFLPTVTKSGWKGSVEPGYPEVKQRNVSEPPPLTERRPTAKTSSQLNKAVSWTPSRNAAKRTSKTPSAESNTSSGHKQQQEGQEEQRPVVDPEQQRKAQADRKRRYKEHTKRTGTGQPRMGDRMQSVLDKLAAQ